ncbi:hypothetical protein G3N56_07820 [Desulfovibrio sulfodismutans]|uniref:Uncharacterized protein n=1 Tax=Desulfolutivibrio sulfodismutans TaxID=63561 RepID=A0A7K3NN76_9BACT|nr:hypothetical protein [Desulfolutivibrio sulfodismutans]NDY56649.1 hypothetical protein [Desulfolutivibrio sulfodismutans]QLA11251.1 hypothetical protein GD606_02640 [Desulfolutivibrio sulfodismutans DSM 3696]
MKIDFSPLSPADGNGLKTVVLSHFLETLGDVHRYYMRFEARSARVWILAECLGYALAICRALLAERGDCFLNLSASGETCRVVEPEGRAS